MRTDRTKRSTTVQTAEARPTASRYLVAAMAMALALTTFGWMAPAMANPNCEMLPDQAAANDKHCQQTVDPQPEPEPEPAPQPEPEPEPQPEPEPEPEVVVEETQPETEVVETEAVETEPVVVEETQPAATEDEGQGVDCDELPDQAEDNVQRCEEAAAVEASLDEEEPQAPETNTVTEPAGAENTLVEVVDNEPGTDTVTQSAPATSHAPTQGLARTTLESFTRDAGAPIVAVDVDTKAARFEAATRRSHEGDSTSEPASWGDDGEFMPLSNGVAQKVTDTMVRGARFFLDSALASARTFAFPLSLALMVGMFLLVQGYIDRNDPKLTEAALKKETVDFA